MLQLYPSILRTLDGLLRVGLVSARKPESYRISLRELFQEVSCRKHLHPYHSPQIQTTKREIHLDFDGFGFAILRRFGRPCSPHSGLQGGV